MASNKDLLNAQRYQRRRLTTVFSMGLPGGQETEPTSMTGPIAVGTILAIVMVAAAALLGKFAPALPDNWENGMLITVKDSGERYFTSKGALLPLGNITTARLASAPGEMTTSSVSASALAEIPRGTPIGIIGAPDDVPTSERLRSDQWTACAIGTVTRTWVAGAPQSLVENGTALVRSEGTAYLVAGNAKYRIEDSALSGVLIALGLESYGIVEVDPSWIAVFADGTPMAPLTIDRAGTPVTGLPASVSSPVIGSVLAAQGDARKYIVTAASTIAPLTEVTAALYSLGSPALAQPTTVPVAELATLTIDTKGVGPTDWPAAISAPNPANAPCATLDLTGTTPTARLSTVPLSALAPADDTPSNSGTAPSSEPSAGDLGVGTSDVTSGSTGTNPAANGPKVMVAGGSGALVRFTDGGALGATVFVSDVGAAHPLGENADDTIARLGWTANDVVTIPVAWQRLIPGGATLSNAQVWAWVPTSSSTPNGPVAGTTGMAVQPAAQPNAEGEACSADKPQLIPAQTSIINQLGLRNAWKTSEGGGVTVAVIDSGVQSTNAHFSGGALLAGVDLTGEADGRVDTYGHGTIVAGLIGARTIKGSGLTGVAPAAKILPIRVYRDTEKETQDAGNGPRIDRMAQGITAAYKAGARIIVVAQSTPNDTPQLQAAVIDATKAGSLVVASAGTNTPEEIDKPRYPAAYPQVLSVGAINPDGTHSDTNARGDTIDITAPGSNVLSAFMGGGDCIFSADTPATSYSAAYVGGIAALVASAHPKETPEEWKYRLTATALRPNPGEHSALDGWGIVAPSAALALDLNTMIPGPPRPDGKTSVPLAVAAASPPDFSVNYGPHIQRVTLVVTAGGVAAAMILTVVRWLRQPKPRPATAAQRGKRGGAGTAGR